MTIDALSQGLKETRRAAQSRYHLETLLAILKSMSCNDVFFYTLLSVVEAALGQRLLTDCKGDCGSKSLLGSQSNHGQVSFMTLSPARCLEMQIYLPFFV